MSESGLRGCIGWEPPGPGRGHFSPVNPSPLPFVNQGFRAKRPTDGPHKLPPGRYETQDFPVLTAGPTPRIALAD